MSLEAVHFGEKLVQRLLPLVMAAAEAGAAAAADRIQFVDEDNAWRALPGVFEEIAYATGADADEHLDELGCRNTEERYPRLPRHRFRQKGLPGAGGAEEENAVRPLSPQPLELPRIAQILHDFLQLLLRLFHTRD